MFNRTLNILNSNSFFLFGARGSGKSSLVRTRFSDIPLLEIDLLDPAEFERALVAAPEVIGRLYQLQTSRAMNCYGAPGLALKSQRYRPTRA